MLSKMKSFGILYLMVKKSDSGATRQPSSTPMDKRGTTSTVSGIDVSVYNNLFMSMALSMSWQLAIAVIVPIVGGYLIDQKVGTSPWLTLTGLVVAMVLTCVVLWRTVREANAKVASLQPKGGKK